MSEFGAGNEDDFLINYEGNLDYYSVFWGISERFHLLGLSERLKLFEKFNFFEIFKISFLLDFGQKITSEEINHALRPHNRLLNAYSVLIEEKILVEFAKKRLKANNHNHQKKLKNPNFRVIYCTRTHSQIKEFIAELKKTKFAKKFRVVHLASKAHYCLHPDIKTCSNATLREEKCRVKREKGGCEFFNWIELYNSKSLIFVSFQF